MKKTITLLLVVCLVVLVYTDTKPSKAINKYFTPVYKSITNSITSIIDDRK